MRIVNLSTLFLLLGACATPCLDDGLNQKPCPEGESLTDSSADTDTSSASATETASATASESNSQTASVSDSDSDGDGCEAELFQSANVPANVLIVLDRSGSMNQSLGGGTKWSVALDAIETFLDEFGTQARFGLMLYPGFNLSCSEGMQCSTGTIVVDPAPMTVAMIEEALDDAQTCSFGTPTAETLESLVGYPGLQDPTRANHVLLITDGESTCEDPVPIVTELRNQTPEVKTFVLGFGGGVDPDELEAMAQAGGTALPGDPSYYQADDAASLDQALQSIGGEFLSCTYTLNKPLDDPEQLYVLFDGIQVPRDPTQDHGWDYDAGTNRVTFFGAACDALQSGDVSDLQLVYGC
jgi:hypothetical protein